MGNKKKKKQKGARGSVDHGLICHYVRSTVHNLFNSMIITPDVYSLPRNPYYYHYYYYMSISVDYHAEFCINLLLYSQFISCGIKKSGQLTHKGGNRGGPCC